jgi:hypothetical protein
VQQDVGEFLDRLDIAARRTDLATIVVRVAFACARIDAIGARAGAVACSLIAWRVAAIHYCGRSAARIRSTGLDFSRATSTTVVLSTASLLEQTARACRVGSALTARTSRLEQIGRASFSPDGPGFDGVSRRDITTESQERENQQGLHDG